MRHLGLKHIGLKHIGLKHIGLALCLTGCTQDEPVPVTAASSPLQRLTATEYVNTVRDLVGAPTLEVTLAVDDGKLAGFDSNAATAVGELTVERYRASAELIADAVAPQLATAHPCEPADQECVAKLTDTLGRRAFRRPLSDAERASLSELYQAGANQGAHPGGVRLVLQGALQSGSFLYRPELGVPRGAAVAKLSDYEVASRMSYLLWDTMPDDALLAAADAGQLATAGGVEVHARRMLDDPRARTTLVAFHVQWLGLDREVTKDAQLYPAFGPELLADMRRETALFIEHTLFDGDGTLDALLTASYAFPSGRTAPLYGVDVAPAGDFFGVPVDPNERAGLLTQPLVMAVHAHRDQGSPVRRGKLVRERLLCDPLQPPPANVAVTVSAPSPDSTERQRFAQHSANPACSGCHRLMDPIGLGMSNYDAVGAFQTNDASGTVDARGEIVDWQDGQFIGAVELSRKLAASDTVRRCVARNWFTFALGRVGAVEDDASFEAVMAAFLQSGRRIDELVVALITSDAFRFKSI